MEQVEREIIYLRDKHERTSLFLRLNMDLNSTRLLLARFYTQPFSARCFFWLPPAAPRACCSIVFSLLCWLFAVAHVLRDSLSLSLSLATGRYIQRRVTLRPVLLIVNRERRYYFARLRFPRGQTYISLPRVSTFFPFEVSGCGCALPLEDVLIDYAE